MHQLKVLVKLMFEAGVVLFVLVPLAYWTWKRSSNRMRAFEVASLVLLAVGYRIWRHMPPYEWGSHDAVVEAQSSPGRSDAPHVASCPVFPADNVWNTPIDSLPKDKQTQAFLDSIGPLHPLHPDFGSDLSSGIPYTLISPFTKRVKIAFDYADDSDLGNYPIPPDAPIEGGPKSTGDRHMLLVDQRRCILYEIFDAHAQPDGSWKAGSGMRMDLTDNALRGDGKTSADAAGLPILPGLVRYDEVQAGAINHALRFTVPHTRAAYVWPGRHKASHSNDPKLPPMGIRFRLRADFNIAGYSKTNEVILKAMKRYGMFLADNGGAMFLSGVADKRWDDDDLHLLSRVKAEDFEAVDESDLQMLPDSARVDPTSAPR
jgi:hypothetical protein